MAKKMGRAMGIQITQQEGKWISYRLKVASITHAQIGQLAGCTREMVSQFLNASKGSEKVGNALAAALGYRDFSVLVAASRGKTA